MLWEWKNRVLLEEDYIFNVAIPLEDGPDLGRRRSRPRIDQEHGREVRSTTRKRQPRKKKPDKTPSTFRVE